MVKNKTYVTPAVEEITALPADEFIRTSGDVDPFMDDKYTFVE